MPKRDDIKRILIVGSGPIVIGQACEFDYSGTQACKALKEEGYETVLLNSNPATIMTDPEIADRTYIEPITVDMISMILEKERPDAMLPTIGGQTALNVTVSASDHGILDRYGVELIGAGIDAIKKAEDRNLFRDAMKRIGMKVPASVIATSIEDAFSSLKSMHYPIIIRPSFTLGGTGGGIAYNSQEFEDIVRYGLDVSPSSEILIEESVIGWKEFELELMRDKNDNVVVICSIENIDPMGVHTGDSITVAPALTLTDKEYQVMRDAAIRIIREIGVDTGGSNIQFSVNPNDGTMYVIEMNPRVSRSSALASKATGYPIAKIAAKLAVGYTLDELPNDITGTTPASFEPVIDYIVVKVPRFTFEKFPGTDPTLNTQMKSVGEVMAIGRTFKESLQKALRSLETGISGLESVIWRGSYLNHTPSKDEIERIIAKLRKPDAERLWYIADAMRAGIPLDDIFEITAVDRWFLYNIEEIVELEKEILLRSLKVADDDTTELSGFDAAFIRRIKESGFSDQHLSSLMGITEDAVRDLRTVNDVFPQFKMVDTCAAEFEAMTPYLYSTYERPVWIMDSHEGGGMCHLSPIAGCEAVPSDRRKVMILGSGPNRIGQGIEFDYCCVHASIALREEGVESIMVNCNPETVSTDYDISDRLYFEPLTFEDVISVVRKERPDGVIVQLGGQTPLKLALSLEKEGVTILGTPPDSIDMAEDRERFDALLGELGLKRPESGTARSVDEARAVAMRIGYPVMIRPSYVLGGRSMEIVYDDQTLVAYMLKIMDVSPNHPVLIDRFLSNAVEVDVDSLSDGRDVVIGGIMEHIEEAGIHSGDSACSIPPHSLDALTIDKIRSQTELLAKSLKVVGLMNVQFAVQGDDVMILEVNPRASRTVPFVSKAVGRPLSKIAVKLMLGITLRELGIVDEMVPPHTSVKEAVFPFLRFSGVDSILGPEMKSTGEVMGIDPDFGISFAKAQMAAGNRLPLTGTVFVSVKDEDKPALVRQMRDLKKLGFTILATKGTRRFLLMNGIDAEAVSKVGEGRPNIVDRIKSGEVAMVINTSFGAKSVADSYSIRRNAIVFGVPYFTTVAGARAAVHGIAKMTSESISVKSLQEYHSFMTSP